MPSLNTDRRVEYMDLDDIELAPRNPKLHDAEGIARSIGHHGLAELPLVDDRTGRLIAGHGRILDLRARHSAGDAPPDGVKAADDRWLVPVQRGWASRSDEDAEAYLVASNNLSARGGWDDAALGAMLADLNEADTELLALTGFTEEDLAALLEQGSDPDDEPPADDDDDVPPPPAVPVSVKGDLWILGEHRLLCGDSLNPDDIDRALGGAVPGIIYTDPPYGINAVGDDGKIGHRTGMPFGGLKGKGKVVKTTAYMPVAGDDSADTAADAFRLLHAAYPDVRHVWWGANHFAASATLPDTSCWLVWDKQTDGNDFADAELAWTNHDGAVRLFRHMWNGMLRASEHGKRVHPTQKPVALARWAFGVVDPKAEATVVLDAFGGSGSTLIAAQETGRTAIVLEAEPAYVDVICQRFERLTGLAPTLEATGEQVSFMPGEREQ